MILIQLAEVHFHLGSFLEGEEQIAIWEMGQEYAERAVKLDPQSADAHYWVAATMGRIGNARGIFVSLFLVNPMLEHLEKALELDPDHSWAHFILSHLYQEIPVKPFGKGDREKSLEHARLAFTIESSEPEFGLHYAKLLFDHNGP